ncbi:protein of unknown function [Candidatus Nitrotoga arctica]|uniref:Uncharacterized protein n=1 Tax=Candidatus Nitrotoga arctica TaxID=453162 RepID=A0ABN8ARP9_9PROT|nr:protein of unknown function [Candidatus Nitrotoga arctica]
MPNWTPSKSNATNSTAIGTIAFDQVDLHRLFGNKPLTNNVTHLARAVILAGMEADSSIAQR